MADLLMARFDIYRNPGKNRSAIPFLMDVQSNVISGLATRIVVPLRSLSTVVPESLPSDLFPIQVVEGKSYFLDTPQLGAIPAQELGAPIVNVIVDQFKIVAALDRAFGSH
jgi:toxin CcdB